MKPLKDEHTPVFVEKAASTIRLIEQAERSSAKLTRASQKLIEQLETERKAKQ